MKEIKAIIQSFMLEKVLDALHEIKKLPGCTVSNVESYARSSVKTAEESAYSPAPKTKLEMVVPDGMVEEVLKVIHKNAYTGQKGDGKVFILEVVDALAIRTGNRGNEAI